MNKEVNINGMRYSDRELSQLIRRRMMSKTHETIKKYSRKNKHKNNNYDLHI